MTLKEFKKLAQNPPKPTGPSFFWLQKIYTDKTLDSVGMKRYPKYSIQEDNYYFPSFVEAEKKLRQMVAEPADKGIVVIGYFIYEQPFSCGEYGEEYNAANHVISWKKYDENGRELDHSRYSELNIHWRTPYGHFYGREDDEWEFKEGEIVEVRNGDEMTLQILIGVGLSTQDAWQRFTENGTVTNPDFRLYPYDWTDDMYTVLDGPDYSYHSHIQPRRIFKPHFPVPLRTKIRLHEYWRKAEEASTRMLAQYKNESPEKQNLNE